MGIDCVKVEIRLDAQIVFINAAPYSSLIMASSNRPGVGIPEELERVFCQLGNHEKYPWKPLPWKGVYNKVLFCDPISGALMELAKVEKGASFPEHYHTTVQTLFLVSGRLRNGDATIEPGTFNIIPAGQLHGPFEAIEESIQFKYFASIPVYILTDGTTYIYKRNGDTIAAGRLGSLKTNTKNLLKP